MTEPARKTFPGRLDQVAHARAFVASALGNCPALDDIVLLASELCANAVRHSASAGGGSFEVTVYLRRKSARVEVRDDGGSVTTPQAGDFGEPSESGLGLGIVAALASNWGYQDDEHGRVVFFELTWATPRARPASSPDLTARHRRAEPSPGGDHQGTVTTNRAGTARPAQPARTTLPVPPVPRREPAPPVATGTRRS